MTDLIKELREWKRKHFDSDRQYCGSKSFDEILSRHEHDKAVEPLEELACRKGQTLHIETHCETGITGIHFSEAKAQEYLETLEDK